MYYASSLACLTVSTLLLFLGASCNVQTSGGRGIAPHAPVLPSGEGDASQDAIEGPSETYRVTSAKDLGEPLNQAFSSFESTHASRGTFLVEISPGLYDGEGVTLSLQASSGSNMKVVVSCSGTRPARLRTVDVHIAANTVALRNLVFDAPVSSVALLYVTFQTRVTFDRISIVGGYVSSDDAEESMVSLHGSGQVSIKNSWFVANKSRWDSKAMLRRPLGTSTDTAKIEMENVVFAGNQAECSFSPGPADAELRDVVFYEPSITDSLLCLSYPHHTLSIERGSFVAGPRAISYRTGTDLQRSNFETVTMTGTTVRLAVPIPSEDAVQRNVRYEPSRTPPSLDALIAAARRGGKPNIAELGL